MIERLLWFILAAVHFLPAMAFAQPRFLTQLYGVAADDPAFLLLQHRAALFACICVVCLWSMVDPAVRRLGVIVVTVSMLSFLVLYRLGNSPAHLQGIAVVDFAALPVLAASAYLAWQKQAG